MKRSIVVAALLSAFMVVALLLVGSDEARAEYSSACYYCKQCTVASPCIIGGEPHYGEHCMRTSVPGARGALGCHESEASLVPHTLECDVSQWSPGCCSVACRVGEECDPQ